MHKYWTGNVLYNAGLEQSRLKIQ